MKWFACAARCEPLHSTLPTDATMTERLPDSLHQKLSERLRFYDDIGIDRFYAVRGISGAPLAVIESIPIQEAGIRTEEPSLPKREAKSAPVVSPAAASPRQSVPVAASDGLSLFESFSKIENDSLPVIRENLGECTRCKLHRTRNKIVFGDGNPGAQLVFVGEGPGADEDEQGFPFVGRAGKLLTQMIEAMGLQRKDVYICNVVKCRPPQNRQPEPDEVKECSPFLLRQIDTIAPKVIVCLGATAAQTILQTNRGISHFRGEWQEFRGRKLIATYHPAYLLRNPAAKSDVWKDLQKVMAELGLAVKKGKSA